MKIRPLEDVLKEYPNYSEILGWHPYAMTIGRMTDRVVTHIENQKFGKVRRIVVCKDDGTPIVFEDKKTGQKTVYDQYQIEEGPADEHGQRAPSSGAIIVPYTTDMNIGLIVNTRAVVIDPKTREQGNYKSLEVPRGFSDLSDKTTKETAIRELGEETGRYALDIEHIGNTNPNNAFYVTSGIPIYAAQVDPTIRSALRKDAKEPILKCEFVPYTEVKKIIRQQQISCGLTLAALACFDAHIEDFSEETPRAYGTLKPRENAKKMI